LKRLKTPNFYGHGPYDAAQNFGILLKSILAVIPKHIPYLLQYWELVYAYHSDGRAIYADHLGSLLVQL
jgi:hypothetical protein